MGFKSSAGLGKAALGRVSGTLVEGFTTDVGIITEFEPSHVLPATNMIRNKAARVRIDGLVLRIVLPPPI